jgi:hypothetical protein
MDRRDFLNQSCCTALAAALLQMQAKLGTTIPGAKPGASTSTLDDSRTTTSHLLTKVNDPDAVTELYQTGARGLGPAPSPYVYAFYDEVANRFISPLAADRKGVKPSLNKGSYTMAPTLQSFNIRQANQEQFKNLKNQIQLSFNATAPFGRSDQLSWIFMNAVDIFLAKDDRGRQDQLTKFTNSNNQTGTALNSNPKIRVERGTITLQVTAFGQKQDSFWTQLFSIMSKVGKSPIVSAVSRGFGIPGLVAEAATFVDGALEAVAQQHKLVNLWQTGGLEFAVTKDASARFNMKPGLWATIDSNYAQQSNFLEGHAVDLQYQSFRITDKNAKPVDANYLVMDIRFQ